MRTIAVLPVKSFAAAKQRLSDARCTGARRALAQAMVSDVVTALRRVRGMEEIVLVTAARAAGMRFTVDPLPSLLLDVDTPEDLSVLSDRLGGRRGTAPLTRGAL